RAGRWPPRAGRARQRSTPGAASPGRSPSGAPEAGRGAALPSPHGWAVTLQRDAGRIY
ncbi:hypothetical protein HMPREF0731_2657, partial [Pseudoroseomonas cervicalis ATCC 49957]